MNSRANRMPNFVQDKNDFLTLLVMTKHLKGKLKIRNFTWKGRKQADSRIQMTSRKRLCHSGSGSMQTSFLPKKR